MSRIGRLPIQLEAGIKVSIDSSKVSVQGPKGELSQELPLGITAQVEGQQLLVSRKDDSKRQKALHGLSRALLANAALTYGAMLAAGRRRALAGNGTG